MLEAANSDGLALRFLVDDMARHRTFPSASFNADGALQAARGYHDTAALLEAVHRQEMRAPRPGGLTVEAVQQAQGRIVSSTVLEALAVELVLKAKLARSGVDVPPSHDHATLFAELPAAEQALAAERYRASLHPAMRPTLQEALAYSASVFEAWRYYHEYQRVEASMGEMQLAFNALAHGL
jgi:hypothetical protein